MWAARMAGWRQGAAQVRMSMREFETMKCGATSNRAAAGDCAGRGRIDGRGHHWRQQDVRPACQVVRDLARAPRPIRRASCRQQAQWANLSVEPVAERMFRAEHVTEGKIAVNEDISTPIFSPYAGRVVKLLVKPSDMVERGQAAVHHRSDRHRAGLERFRDRAERAQHGALETQSRADRREARRTISMPARPFRSRIGSSRRPI